MAFWEFNFMQKWKQIFFSNNVYFRILILQKKMVLLSLYCKLLNHVCLILGVGRLSVILFFLRAITSNLLQLLTFYWKTKMEGELLKDLHFSSKWLNIFHWTKPVHQQATFLVVYFSMLYIAFFLQSAHTEECYKNIGKLLFIAAAFWKKYYDKISTWIHI